MNMKSFLITFGCTILCSCTSPIIPKTAIVDTRVLELSNGSRVTILTQHAINGEIIEDTDNNLNLVSKSDNAKVIGLKAIQFTAFLLAGGSTTINGHTKEQLKGNHIASVRNKTMEYVNPEIDATLESLNLPGNKKYQITVKPYKFKLIYDGLNNNDYEFIYSASISAGNFQHTCSSSNIISSERIRPIAAWEKNTYELTQVVASTIIKKCFEDINLGENRTALTNALLSASEVNI